MGLQHPRTCQNIYHQILILNIWARPFQQHCHVDYPHKLIQPWTHRFNPISIPKYLLHRIENQSQNRKTAWQRKNCFCLRTGYRLLQWEIKAPRVKDPMKKQLHLPILRHYHRLVEQNIQTSMMVFWISQLSPFLQAHPIQLELRHLQQFYQKMKTDIIHYLAVVLIDRQPVAIPLHRLLQVLIDRQQLAIPLRWLLQVRIDRQPVVIPLRLQVIHLPHTALTSQKEPPAFNQITSV